MSSSLETESDSSPLALRYPREMPLRGTADRECRPTDRIAPIDPPALPKAGEKGTALICGAMLLSAFLWAYWPTLKQLVGAWDRIPDYSHGYLVVPFALVILWMRRAEYPGLSPALAWGGLLILFFSFALRCVGAHYYFGGVDGWSMLLWLAGTVWFMGGRALLRWALPALGFLFFMIPLPYGMERGLSLPLQHIAAQVSSWILQVLGQTALAEGSTIWVNQTNFEVERACSGLRIFVGILALTYAYLVIVRRSKREQVLLLASAIPVALAANCGRIVLTVLLYQLVSEAASKRFSHDFAGWVMIPFAAALFAIVLWYVRKLLPDEKQELE
jgi:exosortase